MHDGGDQISRWGQLAKDLNLLRNLLDTKIPRLTKIPDLVVVAAQLAPERQGISAVLATVLMAIESLPDGRGPVAKRLYGLTSDTESKTVRTRREAAIVEFEKLTNSSTTYEVFRTKIEKDLIEDLATSLDGLVNDPPPTKEIEQPPSTAPPTVADARRRRRLLEELPEPSVLAAEASEDAFSLIDQMVSPRVQLLSSHVEGTCDWLYGELLNHLVDVLSESLSAFLTHNENGKHSFTLEPRRTGAHAARVLSDSATFVVAAGTRIERPYEIELSITTDQQSALTATSQLLLSTEGRFVVASMALTSEVAPFEPWAEAVTRAILDSGDRAIEAFVVSQLAFDVTGAVARLYSLVRRYFPREVAETIRLFILDPQLGGGMHLDETARHASLGALRSDSGVEGIGPAEKLLRLAVARFPIADSVAAEIVPSMQTVVRSPLRIPSAHAVGAIQSELFTHELILHPLLNSDRLWIEAGYPARFRATIEPVLDQHRSIIAEHARELDFGPALQSPTGEAFDFAAARARRDQFRRTFGHLIAGYPAPSQE
jgi:hypothetical protein